MLIFTNSVPYLYTLSNKKHKINICKLFDFQQAEVLTLATKRNKLASTPAAFNQI
jgi:hypothetical protein